MTDLNEFYAAAGFLSHEIEQMEHIRRKHRRLALKATWTTIKQVVWPPFGRKHQDALQAATLCGIQAVNAWRRYRDLWLQCTKGGAAPAPEQFPLLVDLRIELESSLDRALDAYELKPEVES